MTRVVVYALMGLVMTAASIDISSEWFWCMLALFITSDWLSRREGYELGVATGFEAYHRMTPQQRAQVTKLLDAGNDNNNNG